MIIRSVLRGALALSFGLKVLAVPISDPATPCKDPTIRKEWRDMANDEKKDYIRAVKCLWEAPPKTNMYAKNIHNRYEDFVAMHINTTIGGWNLDNFRGTTSLLLEFLSSPAMISKIMNNHSPEQILPFHRWTLSLYEDALRNECGYKGGQPYWDYYLDTYEAGGDFMHSPIFDPDTGFGGNGGPTSFDMTFLNGLLPGLGLPQSIPTGDRGGCVQDGPFKNLTLHIGPMGDMSGTTRCLTRALDPMMINMAATKKNHQRILSSKTYLDLGVAIGIPDFHFDLSHGFGMEMNGDFHSIGHGGVGGEMMDAMNSVNDPLFWMHHGSLDRLWALWQEEDPARVRDGSKTWMWMGPMAKNITIADVYDTQNRDGKSILCYKYEGKPFSYYFSEGR